MANPLFVEYEPDSDLRDTEQVPLLEEGGVEALFGARCCPILPMPGSKKMPLKSAMRLVSPRHFYKPQPLRTLEEIRADILTIEKEADGLLDDLLGGGAK